MAYTPPDPLAVSFAEYGLTPGYYPDREHLDFFSGGPWLNFYGESGYGVPLPRGVDFPDATPAPVTGWEMAADFTASVVVSAKIKRQPRFKVDTFASANIDADLAFRWRDAHLTVQVTIVATLRQWYLAAQLSARAEIWGLALRPDLPLSIGVNGFAVSVPAKVATPNDKYVTSETFGVGKEADDIIVGPWNETHWKDRCLGGSTGIFPGKDICYTMPHQVSYNWTMHCFDGVWEGYTWKDRCYDNVWDQTIRERDDITHGLYDWYGIPDMDDFQVPYWRVDEYPTPQPKIRGPEDYDIPHSMTLGFGTEGNNYQHPRVLGINNRVNFSSVTWRSYEKVRAKVTDTFVYDIDFGVGQPVNNGCGTTIYWDGLQANDRTITWPIVVDPDDEDPESTKTEPWRTRYFVVNSIIVKRVSDGTEVEVIGFQLDMNPYLKEDGIQLSLYSRSDWLILAPGATPVDVEIILNGTKRVFALTKSSEEDAFLGSRFTVSGKSLTTYLGEPYTNPGSKTFDSPYAVGALVDEILLNTGWTATVSGYWDEVIPADSYSMQNKTPIAAIKEIADALGLSVRPDKELQHINLELLYPCTPSVLGGAIKDYVVDAAAVVSMNHTLDLGALGNGVWVGGRNVGVFDHIVEQGTDGSASLPMYINDLIATHKLSQQKGVALLSASKRKRTTSIKFPIYPSTDILIPNRKFRLTDAKYGTWPGFTRRVVISGRWVNKALEVYQSVELERFE